MSMYFFVFGENVHYYMLQFSRQPDYMSGHKCAILGRGDNS